MKHCSFRFVMFGLMRSKDGSLSLAYMMEFIVYMIEYLTIYGIIHIITLKYHIQARAYLFKALNRYIL